VTGDEGARYQVALSTDQLKPFIESLAESLAVDPVNARFIFNDETRQLEVIQPAVIGRRLDVQGSLEAINQKLAQGEHKLPLAFEYQEPPAGDSATAEALGITGLVSAETSYFYGSSGARIQNIQTAAARFHGQLIPPGATFSMADALGDISLDNGYAEALIIFGNRTIQGVGGGVCQVSTTLFRTVFFGGFPVAERHPHAYRVYYYELTADNRQNAALAGLDATVYVPLVDFKFTNDTPNWLLMETYVNPSARTLTWKFYSTPDGRTVEWDTTGLRNQIEPPDPLYQENPELSKGEIKQVDWAVEGADVTVNRTVKRDGQVHFQDSYYTHYMPWRAVYEYGPKTKGIPTQEPTGEPQG
jgi:vancomycin resistance protein YoaR